jgi:hypothetical protein
MGFYHGGDRKGPGREARLHPGVLAPRPSGSGLYYKNKLGAGRPGEESAGYHGYWITDFTTVDPHFGTEADMRAFVDAVHRAA